MNVLELRGVSIIYQNTKEVLDGFDIFSDIDT